QLRHLSRQCQRSRGAPGGALLAVRPHPRPDAPAARRAQSRFPLYPRLALSRSVLMVGLESAERPPRTGSARSPRLRAANASCAVVTAAAKPRVVLAGSHG